MRTRWEREIIRETYRVFLRTCFLICAGSLFRDLLFPSLIVLGLLDTLTFSKLQITLCPGLSGFWKIIDVKVVCNFLIKLVGAKHQFRKFLKVACSRESQTITDSISQTLTPQLKLSKVELSAYRSRTDLQKLKHAIS